MTRPWISGRFSQPKPRPEGEIASAVGLKLSGRLTRHNTVQGKTALSKREHAGCQGGRYALAPASGGKAMRTVIAEWNLRFERMTLALSRIPAIRLTLWASAKAHVGSSIHFFWAGLSGTAALDFEVGLAQVGMR